MSDDFDARAVAWLREAARPDPTSLSSVRRTIDSLPERHRGRHRGLLLATAAVLAVVAVGLSSVVLAPRQDGSAPTRPSQPVPSVSATATPGRSPADDGSPPTWALDLGGQLECDGPAADIGGEVGRLGSYEPGPTPDAALQQLLDARLYASFPARGFDPAVVEGRWARHAYRVDGRIRALAVTTDQAEGFPAGDGWHVAGIKACDASEFDPADGLTFDQTLWLDRDGDIERSDRIHSSPGPGHCGWESAILLRFEGVQYIRDPEGVLSDATVVSFTADGSLPPGAIDTGLHTDTWRLHTAPGGNAVYFVTSTGVVERWGRAKDEIACR
jgi:hypothetical protein